MRILEGLKGEPETPVVAAAPEPPVEPPVAPPVEPPVEPPVVPAAPAAPAIKRIRSVAQDHPLLSTEPAPRQPAVAPVLPPVTSQPDMALTEEQRDELAEAMVAERLFPDKYKGFSDRLRAWMQKSSSEQEALFQQNPNITQEDDEYQATLKGKPRIGEGDARKVLRTMGAEEATRATRQEMQPAIEKAAMDAKYAKILPEVKEFVSKKFGLYIAQVIQSDEKSPLLPCLKLYLEKGEEAAAKKYPLEFNILRDQTRTIQTMTAEFMFMRNNAKPFDPANPHHLAVSDFIAQEGRAFEQKGGKMLVRNGRMFMPREKFLSLYRTDLEEWKSWDEQNWTTNRYWTFTDTAITDMMGWRVKQASENLIDAERQRAKRYGFTEAPPEQIENPQPPPPEPIRAPRTTVTPAPGSTTPPKTASTEGDTAIPVSKVASYLKKTTV
jgi:hypothetical protein